MARSTGRATTTEERRPRVSLPILAIGLAVAYLPYYLPSLARTWGGVDVGAWGPPGVILWNWAAVAFLVVFVTQVERLGLSSLRLVRPTERDIEWAGYLGGLALGWQWLTTRLFPSNGGETAGGAEQLFALGPAIALGLVVTTATTEEILWRGYVVERLAAWVGPVVAATIGLAVFSVAHVTFFGASWLVTNLPGAAALYVLLLWRRNLWAAMFCHSILNFPIVVVALSGSG
jgi:uncharacterized protein